MLDATISEKRHQCSHRLEGIQRQNPIDHSRHLIFTVWPDGNARTLSKFFDNFFRTHGVCRMPLKFIDVGGVPVTVGVGVGGVPVAVGVAVGVGVGVVVPSVSTRLVRV